MRTVASYLGHSSVSMTPNAYADVVPDARMAATDNVEDSFETNFAVYRDLPTNSFDEKPAAKPAIFFYHRTATSHACRSKV